MIGKALFFGLLAYTGYYIFRYTVFMGRHVSVHKHHPGPCKEIPGLAHGSEDVVLLPGDKILITSGLRFLERHNKRYQDSTAAIYLFDFNHPDKGPQQVAISGFRDLKECDFHGISSWVDKKTGSITIFVVNHLETESVVEMFSYDVTQMTLTHQETIGSGDPNFGLLNDVAAVGPRQFYVTNFLYTRNPLEITLQMKWSFVTYFDGKDSQIANVNNERYLMLNGITASDDGRYIYVADFYEKELVIFTRNDDNKLTMKERVPLYTAVDNIITDPDTGDLWIGCHPIPKDTSAYLDNPGHISPSQVIRLKMKDGSVTDVTEVMMDDGKLISGSTVAIQRKNKMFVGTVATNAILCDVKYI